MAKQKRYSDLDLNFTAHPVSGDISMKYDEEAIKRSIRNLILLSTGEKFFHSDIGSGVRELLFENFTPIVKIQLESKIRGVIENHEPRAQLIDTNIFFSEIDQRLEVTIRFSAKGIPGIFDITTPLERLR